MQLNQLKPKIKTKNKKRIGRGGKRGTYSGRGIKGQKSRAGRKIRPQLRDIIKRIPKKRGYRFKSIKKKPTIINLAVLEENFKNNDKITPSFLLKKGLLKKTKGVLPAVKILAFGNLTKKIFLSGCDFSKQAREKIEKAGGKIIK